MVDTTAGDNATITSQQICVPEKKNTREHFCSTFKMFILSLAFTYFTKTLCGTYMKSVITQIERRFDLSSTLVGFIDGSFEMGNLLFLALVSYYGAKLHRPRLIGCGCFLMSLGCALTGLPHFFMGRYKYDTTIPDSMNQTVNIVACQDLRMQSNYLDIHPEHSQGFKAGAGCLNEPGSNLWVYVFLGNAIRGIGETPLMPLGISYVDDFAKAENSAFYIGCLQAVALMGPMFGYILGALVSKLYVDVGFVDTETVTITPNDVRWIGAWWLGFFISSALLLLGGIPFWFFPRSLLKQEEGQSHRDNPSSHHDNQEHTVYSSVLYMKLADMTKGFLSSLKKLLGNPVYIVILCEQILIFSAFIGLFTFKVKYMEQHFGLSSSRANLLIGLTNVSLSTLGMFLGGLLMKKYKLSLLSAAQLAFLTSSLAFLLLCLQFIIKCDNISLAGLTVSYNGTPQISYDEQTLFSQCNQNCSCSAAKWDPVCSADGITYMSPCLAGCISSTGVGKNTVFHNCSCVLNLSPVEGSSSVSLGQCPHTSACNRSLTSYVAIFGVLYFIKALGVTPIFMVMIRCTLPELKSLAIGIQTLAIRTLAGIPSPVYFGFAIDSTCLKWDMSNCRSRGSCHMYDTNMYRIIFLGLMTGLFGCSLLFNLSVIVLFRSQFRMKAVRPLMQTHQDDIELQGPNQQCKDGTESHTEKANSANG
ncbi:solute carrier organic anion transporter family member 1C1 [Ictalurus punctatus]|uniref:Solute carrier organic anion transporter family member n=1 Tax=Ictalurus punctatus TaxID=7998 RepID=A0A2D0T400_ICTPU|nr:solute carrier organic anion transporter family member 1C1 [Ictalurus punctatus]